MEAFLCVHIYHVLIFHRLFIRNSDLLYNNITAMGTGEVSSNIDKVAQKRGLYCKNKMHRLETTIKK